ncbi:MAG: TlpA family protein disulfide reductase [Gammaproteobacteria bacterium]
MRVFILGLGLLSVLWLTPAGALDPGDTAPALKATTLDGKPFDLAAEKGKVVVLNLWATWCGPCRKEMPLLDAFYKKYRERGVSLVGLDEDDPDNIAKVRTVMKAFTYPAVMAQTAATNDFRAPRVLPITYVIDQHGVIRAKFWAGSKMVTASDLDAAVTALLPTQN